MTTNNDDLNKKPSLPAKFSPGTTGIGKEGGAIGEVKTGEILKESSLEMELPKEVKEMGARVHKEVIELPPDVKKLGVTSVGAGTPVTSSTATTVVLPISDQQVVAGLHAQITSALHWLAAWCVRKLKQAHMTIKVVHGKIMRVEAK
ncbi:MAG: hypothetical protein UU37_C0003G0035 [Candidatus Gottesmanbacteria bacterium GW2011_GWA2_41_12]|uniref:Uncharacterized protein n=2 Tax=Candidatus Gottesmaniibacteriota TaxID=1752720 RepID=A0A0G0ULQ0_9BACT|nr:MAG: hypothetical protein UT63_C0025G0019 [Candidatus Gottesmanbacteria bacterium GW2011_GWC2_39_8]KKR88461.1 MAG: hypothetical protein UU37_C0003G0035 [Candidatus Gottesmanbacteria bacterium GW2011_GWA2_41_12]